ncbi:M23 family metallopeptidase [Georgenia wangjunii]|uniref:M23 family metallopeptidase n=1 Tax=Georgenia wangjunii TaxID=3117730 RepID=UPI002F25FE35
MKRTIARWQTLWLRLFALAVITGVTLPTWLPARLDLVLVVGLFLLSLVRPPRSERAPVPLPAPVRGRWVALNSPGSAVPSHGVKAYGQTYAVDLLRPSSDARASLGWSLRTRRPESYPAFGEPVLSMAPGTVVAARDAARDHGARDTWPTVLWMMTIEGFVRELGGASRILGNHVIVAHDDGTYAAYAHLRRGSATVRTGERVTAGQQLGAVGNTGNTSEPHLHVQLMDHAIPQAAAGVPMLWPDLSVDPAERDARWGAGEPKATALAWFPPSGQIFEA